MHQTAQLPKKAVLLKRVVQRLHKEKEEEFAQAWQMQMVSSLHHHTFYHHEATPNRHGKGTSFWEKRLRQPKAFIGAMSGYEYITAQFAQACTHVHCKHLRVCVKYRLCNKRSFRSVDIQKHCMVVHQDAEAKWFKPVPPLEGTTVEITEETLHTNIVLSEKGIKSCKAGRRRWPPNALTPLKCVSGRCVT